jgi:lon-related putative ATP-dependent protease
MELTDFELRAEDLSCTIAQDEIQDMLAEARPGVAVVQPRAMEAIRMGMAIGAKGYNVYVSGAPGTGRRTAVLSLIKEGAAHRRETGDFAYVCNFRNPLCPKLLAFPRGEARRFKKELAKLVENAQSMARLQAESDAFRRAESELLKEAEAAEGKLLSDFEAEIDRNGFAIAQTGPDDEKTAEVAPVIDGKPATFDEVRALVDSGAMTEAEYESKRARYYDYSDRLRRVFDDIRQSRIELEEKVRKAKVELFRPRLQSEIDSLLNRHPSDAIKRWVRELERDILGHLRPFTESGEEAEGQGKPRTFNARYGVNVIVDASDSDGPPVVFADVPTSANLFGSIDWTQEDADDPYPSFQRIRPGSLLEATGGYIILKAEDVVQEEEAWTYLKHVLQTGLLEIQPQAGPFGPSTSGTRPEPVPIDLKVVMIGNEMSYDVLFQADQDFQKLFKVYAEFDSSMPRDRRSTVTYLAFMLKVADEEGLRPLTVGGMAAALEQAVRQSEYRNRYSARLSRVADLLREADYQARASGKGSIGPEEIAKAIERRAYLFSLPEEKLGEMIVSGEIVLSVSGISIGRVNGLAVHDRGYYAFGMPAVISAQVSPGASGVINIEGESGLSGEIYDKAVLIVEGFLRSRYAREFPLSVAASICFEQSYTAVEGDSASSTAVYALLSAIARVPLRQDVAVTGSVNQMGQIQPVGGVAEKIEGFFGICKKLGLTGSQGVMVPRQNVVNLTLSSEVRDAVREGRFHVWAVSTIDEGIYVLTGEDPGKRQRDGGFPPGCFNARVRESLKDMAELMRKYAS